MKISINGNPEEIPHALTIKELLAFKKVEQPLMVTVELNGVILQRTSLNPSGPGKMTRWSFFISWAGAAGVICHLVK